MTPRLETERLILDPPRDDDADAVFEACQDPETQRWVPLPSPYTRESAEYFVGSYCRHGVASGQYTVWALRDRASGRFEGVLEVRRDEAAGSASLGCWLAPWARGRGLMREALVAIAAYALDPDGLGFARLHWECLADNDDSRRLAESAGFVFDGAPHAVSFRGEEREALVGTLSRDGVHS